MAHPDVSRAYALLPVYGEAGHPAGLSCNRPERRVGSQHREAKLRQEMLRCIARHSAEPAELPIPEKRGTVGPGRVLDWTAGRVREPSACSYEAMKFPFWPFPCEEVPMPMIISTMDEIMAREKRDMLFIQFGAIFDFDRSQNPSMQRHFKWFDVKGLRYEIAAPRGWLSGDPGIFAVHFDGPSDPRLADYVAAFENTDGKSLVPDEYQMGLLIYEKWLLDPKRRLEDQADDGDEQF